MRIIIRNLILLLPLTLLFGCAVSPNKLGIPDSEWNSYDKAKQEKLLADYKNLNVAEAAADSKADEKYASVNNGTYTGSLLKVRISGGEAMLPPFADSQAYETTIFDVIPGTCVNTPIEPQSGDKNAVANLRACYKNNVLLLDPSRYDANKKDGTIRLPYSPLWNNGFTYRGINTDGFIRFKNVNVSVIQKQK